MQANLTRTKLAANGYHVTAFSLPWCIGTLGKDKRKSPN
jgi:hypothetical protein